MYPACRACRSTFNIFGSAYKCTKEKCLSTEFNYRYKLCLMGADESGCELEFVLFDKIAQHLIGKPVDRLQKLYSMDDTPKEVSGLVGQKYTFIVKISVKKSIKSLDPSFEVVYVSQQHGRQTNIPIIPKVENIDTSISSSAYLAELPITSIAKAPLKPIKSKGNIELGSIIPPLQPPSEGDPMDIEQNVNISQENMYATKRPYTDKTQEGYDEDEDTKNVRQHKRSRQ
uniref:Replication factor A C-terminal domain-containing protein n=1 Tax=Arundo donax TaxID=35708 RepID=A0A0A9BZL3_ARUDO